VARRLENTVIIVTGASRGLGRYCAIEYGREGATVIVAARTEEQTDERLPGTIHETAAEVTAAGGHGVPIAANMADPESIQHLADSVFDQFGRIDVLMNNAGILPPGGISTVPPKHWDLEMRINLNGPFHLTRAVLPTMQSQGSGSIINISSVAADTLMGHYGVSKKAIEAMTIAFSKELAPAGIAVNALKPVGAIETPGMHMGTRDPSIFDELPPADRYVEAAVIMALLTPETGTGLCLNDAEVIERFGDESLKERLLALPMR